MLPRNISQSHYSPTTKITQSLCSPVPMFPIFPSPYMFPSPYVPQSLCSLVHLFPSPYSVHQSLCSPVPMFPTTIPQKCFPFPIFPKHVPQSLCSPEPMFPKHKIGTGNGSGEYRVWGTKDLGEQRDWEYLWGTLGWETIYGEYRDWGIKGLENIGVGKQRGWETVFRSYENTPRWMPSNPTDDESSLYRLM